MKRSALFILLTVFTGFFFSGCEEGPVGFDELDRDSLEVDEITLEPDTMASYPLEITLGGAATLIGGRDSITEIRILMAVDGMDSIVLLDSAKLLLRRYDTTDIATHEITFRAYPLLVDLVEKTWDEKTCTWILRNEYRQWDEPGADYDSEDLLFEFTAGGEEIEITLDPDKLDTYQKGFILVPQNDGFAYFGSYEADTSQEPRIIGFNEDGDTITFSSAENEKYYASVLDATIVQPFTVPTSDYLIGAGLAWRTYMRFPIDALPDTVDITSAEFRMVYEPYFIPEKYYDACCYRLIEPYDGIFTELSTAMAGRDSVELADDTVSISLVDIVQFWADEPDSNFGISACHAFLKASSTFGQEKRIYALGRVIGTPQLIVTYTKPPSGRFSGGEE